MDLEPVGAPAVSGSGLGHADHEALAETARFASRSVLLVDDAFSVVFALRDGVQVVVGAPEERLEREKGVWLVTYSYVGICVTSYEYSEYMFLEYFVWNVDIDRKLFISTVDQSLHLYNYSIPLTYR